MRKSSTFTPRFIESLWLVETNSERNGMDFLASNSKTIVDLDVNLALKDFMYKLHEGKRLIYLSN